MLRIKPMLQGGRLIIDIGYKYTARKVLYFIVIENTGIAQAGLPYLSKYPDHLFTLLLVPLSCISSFDVLMMVNPIIYKRQYDLALEKFWVTQCGWIRLCTTVSMLMTITNF